MIAIENKKRELGVQQFGRMILDKTVSAEKSSRSNYVSQKSFLNGKLCIIYFACKSRH